MRICYNTGHAAYCHSLVSMFPEHEWTIFGWEVHNRQVPSNCIIGSLDAIEGEFDVFVNEVFWRDTSKISAAHRVWIFHNEEYFNDESVERIDRVFNRDGNNKIVVVSDHKRSTLRQYAYDPRVSTIRFNCSFPERTTQPATGLVGSVHCNMFEQQIDVFKRATEGFNHVLIGQKNERFDSPNKIVPSTWDEFVSEFHKIDVYVNVVVGDQWGMSPMEAMASGIPVITGFSTDLPDQIVPGWNCIMVNDRANRAIDDIRHWIKTLIVDRDLNHQIGQRGKEMVYRYFSPQKFRDKWKAVLNEN